MAVFSAVRIEPNPNRAYKDCANLVNEEKSDACIIFNASKSQLKGLSDDYCIISQEGTSLAYKENTVALKTLQFFNLMDILLSYSSFTSLASPIVCEVGLLSHSCRSCFALLEDATTHSALILCSLDTTGLSPVLLHSVLSVFLDVLYDPFVGLSKAWDCKRIAFFAPQQAAESPSLLNSLRDTAGTGVEVVGALVSTPVYSNSTCVLLYAVDACESRTRDMFHHFSASGGDVASVEMSTHGEPFRTIEFTRASDGTFLLQKSFLPVNVDYLFRLTFRDRPETPQVSFFTMGNKNKLLAPLASEHPVHYTVYTQNVKCTQKPDGKNVANRNPISSVDSLLCE
ncbi:hypothetical protein, conserved [Angomonas deanei]|uniref:Uncharacterized protein n=1 Tax=Angomonas deanei TaxID=59799 RepID=A0A7G2CSC8_9TRYP|nr:hypothetical protein, conserved [Angomonas deanei]